MTPTLFLHGGPGLNAGVERAWFGDSLPIVWWDQPPIADTGAPFDALVDSCQAKVTALATSCDTPVRLLAHSFGGQLAAALARRIPQSIASITLLACSPDLARAIRRLGERLGSDHSNDQALCNALAHVEETGAEAETLLTLFGACNPYFPSAWFAPQSKQVLNRFVSLSSAMQFDAATFVAVLRESLQRPPIGIAPTPYTGSVRLLVGAHDRFLSVQQDQAAWRSIFPQLQCEVLDCGHAVHFEIEPAVWA